MKDFLLKSEQPFQYSASSMLMLLSLLFVTYGAQALLPAFNADDIIQAQYPSDAYNFIGQGRWGYFLIYSELQGALPAPVVSSFFGCICLLLSALLAASLLGIKRSYAVFIFVSVASISLYYGKLFSFDSTRLAYPIGNLFAVAGLYAVVRGGKILFFLGLLGLSIAPAFYPASTELAAVIFFGLLIVSLIGDFSEVTVKRLTIAAVSLLFSLILYLLITKALYYFTGWVMGSRADIDLLAVLSRYNEIICLFSEHSFPFYELAQCQKPQFLGHLGSFERVSFGLVFVLFNIVCLKSLSGNRKSYVFVFLLAEVLLLLSPFGLIFASKNSVFPVRSLYSVSYVYAFFLAFLSLYLYERFRSKRDLIIFFSAGVAFLWVLLAMVDISNKAFRDYINSQRSLYAVNRVISDIERVLADHEMSAERRISMAIINNNPRIGGVTHIPWSRERVYHLLDPRYEPVTNAERERVLAALGNRPQWPAKGSIYFDQKTLVVVISQ